MFGKKTVAGVLAAFNKAIDDLQRVEQEQQAEAVRQAQAIEEARAAHDAAIKEASAAREVSGRLSELLKPHIVDVGVDALRGEVA